MAGTETTTGIGTKGQEIKAEYNKFIGRKVLFILGSLILIALVAGISTTLGSYPLRITEVYMIIWRGLFHDPEAASEIVIWNLRLPRIILGILAGIGLAISGTVMQGILRNPLASPFTLGIASGAGFGAALAIILSTGLILDRYLIIGNAFFFALIPTLIIVGLTRYQRATPETMVLAGIAMVYIFSAATTLLQYFGEPEAVKETVFWMVGSLGRASWENLIPVSIVLIGCLIPLMWTAWDLNALTAGDEVAKSLGVNVERTRITIMLLATLLTAGIISFTGTIGFIGLVSPHICRMIIGGDHRFLIPASGLCGALLLLSADTLARLIIAPIILPVGVLTAFMGGPLFLYLILRRRREYW